MNMSENPAEIFRVVKNTLRYIDPRLMEHGERVAFIATSIAEHSRIKEEFDISKVFILALIHDIGAYKTEEINNMLSFETNGTINHAVYGALLVKYITPMDGCEDAILYHHTRYDEFEDRDSPMMKYAQLIHIADRVDIAFTYNDNFDMGLLKALSGTRFNPDLVDGFFEAEEKSGILAKIVDKTYREQIEELALNVAINRDTAFEYLKMLVYAIDFRSRYTVTHTVNVATISVEIGKIMGLDDRDLENIYYGAFLHDLGKIAIPKEILESPERLTKQQMEIMKSHVVKTGEIIHGFVDDTIYEIAMRHHERPNGTGYPNKLHDIDLTCPQKIVAVSDVLGALNDKRSYKEAYSKDMTLSILNNMAKIGNLSPAVVKHVSENYEKIIDKAILESSNVIKMYMDMAEEYKKIKLTEMAHR